MRWAVRFKQLVILGLARRVLEQLPAPLRQVLEQGVDLQVKPLVDAEDRERGATPEIRGYYWGEQDPTTGYEELAPHEWHPRPKIVLIAGNIEPTAEAVTAVLLHELGHHLGFSEWELCEGLGLA